MADTKISALTALDQSTADPAKTYVPLFHEDGSPLNRRMNFTNLRVGSFLHAGASGSAARFSSAGNGVAVLTNDAGNDLSRVCFGGTTSSFPALKRSGAALHLRLADDSAFANLQLGNLTLNAGGYINASFVAGTLPQHLLGGWGLASDGNGPVLYGTQTGAHRISRTSSASSAGLYLYGIGGEVAHLIGSVALGGPAQDPNTFLVAEAPYVLAQRYGSSAELLRVYETYTDSTTFSRGVFGFRDAASGGTGTGSATTVLRIGTEKGSVGGTARAVSIVTDGTERINVAANGDISLGVHSAIASEVVTGYITIKDLAGNVRKLAVVS